MPVAKKKAPAKKATKKAPAKKAAAKKAPAKKAPAKKAAVKKAVAKKAPAKKAPAKKAVKKVAAWKPKAVATKAELIESMKASMPALELSTKATNEMLDNLFTLLAVSIKKNKRFSVSGFGTFNVKKRKARWGRNPQTGDKIKIKASKTVSFKPTPKLKETL